MMLIVMISSCGHHDNQPEIKQAVDFLVHRYPESTLQDIYKSFFQDEYGPGHLLSDTGAAKRYLENELSAMTSQGNYQAEPCGTGKNFVRVPLDLVKDGLIPPDPFFNAFIAGASEFKLPDIVDWQGKWTVIVDMIEKMNPDIDNFPADKEAIGKMLERGEYVVHHSESYSRNYDPHYRIMGKAHWETIQKKYLAGNNIQ